MDVHSSFVEIRVWKTFYPVVSVMPDVWPESSLVLHNHSIPTCRRARGIVNRGIFQYQEAQTWNSCKDSWNSDEKFILSSLRQLFAYNELVLNCIWIDAVTADRH